MNVRLSAAILSVVALVAANGSIAAQQPAATPQALTYDLALKAIDGTTSGMGQKGTDNTVATVKVHG